VNELELAPETKYHRSYDEEKRDNVIPSHVFTKVDPCERYEHAQRDHLLDDFQLKRAELAIADTVRGN